MAGKRDHRDHIGQVSTFLRDIRRHQWDASLPPSAVIFPEDYPRPGQRLPRALAGHVMAQVEDPANLERQENLAYRLITLILIRCGLRITDATAIPTGCVVRDADGAPARRCAPGSPPPSTATGSSPTRMPGSVASSPGHSATSGRHGPDQVTLKEAETTGVTPRASRRRHCPRRDAAGQCPG